ncbi:hypothetical protein AB0F18_30765 [Streptomyces sp. NPDC029216]|uniref:hypothetical protein n=1 Tax=Streptomyces sp. NPDC029216 TaxID=3154701 RepID=UPI0033E280E2
MREYYTRDDQRPPSERAIRDGYGNTLPTGQMLCVHDDALEAEYRQVTGWRSRREVASPADPLEPPDYLDADVWSLLRHNEPYSTAYWTVSLDCGHVDEAVATAIGWQPGDGAVLTDPARARQMSAEYEDLWAANPDLVSERERGHTAACWPLPRPERLCYTCPHTRWIVAYQRVGWLVPRSADHVEQLAPVGPSRAELERRLRRAESQPEHLRTQLAQREE